MDDQTEAGEIVGGDFEPMYELSQDAIEYLAQNALPEDGRG